jgi:hypothetical protein
MDVCDRAEGVGPAPELALNQSFSRKPLGAVLVKTPDQRQAENAVGDAKHIAKLVAKRGFAFS